MPVSSAQMAALLAEVDTFLDSASSEAGSVVYYKHESGVVFATPLDILHRSYLFKFVDGGVPIDAAPYEPDEGTRESEHLDRWTTACDSMLEALVSRETPPN